MAKRTQLRTKVARATTKSLKQTGEDLPEDPQAFLHAYKETKKEKLQSKRQNLLTKLTSDSAISKSSLRRRKRKEKQELKPKMEELLTTLEESIGDTINVVDSAQFLEKKHAHAHAPNTRTKKGLQKVESQERQRFGLILKDQTFQKSPFEALRESIANRLKEEQQ
jgi:ribosome biogenesis protein SLX9